MERFRRSHEHNATRADTRVVRDAGRRQRSLHRHCARRARRRHVARAPRRSVTLDLSGTTFIDSSGLGVLVGALKRLREAGGESIALSGMQDQVRKVFEITGLTTLFTVE